MTGKPSSKSFKNPIFVFVDESGNLDFSGNGTDHFVLSAFITPEPWSCIQRSTKLVYELISRGLHDQIPFHATQNSVGTRKRFIDSLCEDTHACKVHSIYADKHLTHPRLHRPEVFYSLLGVALGKYLLKTLGHNHDLIALMFDSALTGKKKTAFLKSVKPELNKLNARYEISFRPVKYDVNGQIADYYAWSLFRKLESNDSTWFDVLPGPHTEFNIFSQGRIRYW